MSKLIESHIPGMDFIIGFEIYRVLNDKPQIKVNGIAIKKQFKLYCVVLRQFQLTKEDQIMEIEAQITQHSCVESHIEFLTECDNHYGKMKSSSLSYL